MNTTLLSKARRFVVKVGSALVTNNGAGLDLAAIDDWARQIAVLREQRLIRTDENGKLVYDAALETWAKDAKLVLSREVIHSILKVTPEMARGVEPAAAED